MICCLEISLSFAFVVSRNWYKFLLACFNEGFCVCVFTTVRVCVCCVVLAYIDAQKYAKSFLKACQMPKCVACKYLIVSTKH